MNFFQKKYSKKFCSSKNRLTFVLAFGKQRRNAAPIKQDDP